VYRLRYKLILIFLTATLIPTSLILWMSVTLLNRSLSYVATDDLDMLSRSLEDVARNYYRQSREILKEDSVSGRAEALRWNPDEISDATASIKQFWESGDPERFERSEPDGDRLLYMVRRDREVRVYSRPLGVRMTELERQLQLTRAQLETLRRHDLRRGFTLTLLILSAAVWVLALASVLYMANRISRPIQDLTTGLHRLARGDFDFRLHSDRRDEAGQAVQAFNHTAGHLQQNRDRLVYLTQIASWQLLARKMAHELKNSLTPIRLTVEEIVARHSAEDRKFLDKAAGVVIEEVESLERRLRAFSDFAAEPVTSAVPLDINSLLKERIQFLSVEHPDVVYRYEPDDDLPLARADADRIKGILTNLLQNAAEAAGSGGGVRAITRKEQNRLVVEIHDSGPGLNEEARRSLFEPSISFKKNGMGLGLSISRKNALLAGGDLIAIKGSMGGAGFRLELPFGETNN
jgi:two-component system, NtrC family, nitrogen regulation sensor histidine kinase NtrY